jgi:hypothetical protein
MKKTGQRWWGWVLLMPMAAMACRYSVRDTGFVDLGAGGYRLEWAAPADFPEKGTREWAQAAAALLADSNVQYSAIRADGNGTGELRLSDPAGRTLSVARIGPESGTDAFRWVDSVVSSPARDRLLRESLRSYAVVVLVEGTDAAGNARVAEAARAAIASVSRLIPGMPKPVSVPPQMLLVPVAQQAGERVFLWGLGMEPGTVTEPRLALVYGRGRRLGGTLEGPLITATALRERLVLVGQDCECDLDRAWLRGPMIPARWDAALQQAAAKTLGFDPENPMVRAEVGRIVDRGPVPGQKRRMTGTSQELGYSEDSVDAVPVATEVEEAVGEERREVSRVEERHEPAEPAPTETARTGWWVLAGALAAAVVAGVGIFFKGSRA